MYNGLPERLTKEIKALAPESMKEEVKVIQPEDRERRTGRTAG
jgi:actin-related protein